MDDNVTATLGIPVMIYLLISGTVDHVLRFSYSQFQFTAKSFVFKSEERIWWYRGHLRSTYLETLSAAPYLSSMVTQHSVISPSQTPGTTFN